MSDGYPVSSEGFSYLTVPFQGQIGGGAKSSVAEQLQEAINRFVSQGWDYYRMEEVSIKVSPGCLGSLLGGSESYINYNFIIFRKRNIV